jgi:uncharacterized protein with von Willebrand factor type A (vWA) domain
VSVPEPTSPVGDDVSAGSSRRSARSARYRAEALRVKPFESIARRVITRRAELGLSRSALADRIDCFVMPGPYERADIVEAAMVGLARVFT